MTDYYIDKGQKRQGVVLAAIRALPDDKRWKVSITEAKASRSLEQNRYLHGVIIPAFCKRTGKDKDRQRKSLAGEFLGYDVEDMPQEIRDLYIEVGEKPPEFVFIPKSTKRLSVAEFGDFIEQCHAKAVDQGIEIPAPPWYQDGR